MKAMPKYGICSHERAFFLISVSLRPPYVAMNESHSHIFSTATTDHGRIAATLLSTYLLLESKKKNTLL
jgi:hypothetical protein